MFSTVQGKIDGNDGTEEKYSGTWKVGFASTTSIFFKNYSNILAGLTFGLVFASVFFPSFSIYSGLFISLVTYLVGYVAGVVGAFIFGNLGDRSGRRNSGFFSLLAVSLSSLGIALIPGYSNIGVTSDILLVIFRFVGGMGIATMVGDSAWFVEHGAKSHRRGMRSSWFAVAQALSVSAVVLPLYYMLTVYGHPFLVATGWRIMYYVGAIGVILAFFMRYKLTDTKIFHELEVSKKIEKIPVLEVFRPYWKEIIILTIVQGASASGIIGMTSFTPSFLSSEHLSSALALISLGIIVLLAIPVKFFSGYLQDRFGRVKTMQLSAILTAIWAIPFYYILTHLTGGLPELMLDEFVLYALASGIGGSAVGSLFAEQFSSRYRYSGVNISYNLGQVVASLVASIIAAYFLLIFKGPFTSWPYLGALILVTNLVAFILMFKLKETFKDPIVAN